MNSYSSQTRFSEKETLVLGTIIAITLRMRFNLYFLRMYSVVLLRIS